MLEELTQEEENLSWPDQVYARGRPRAVKWGHILRAVRRGIMYRVNDTPTLHREWTFVYGDLEQKNVQQLSYRMKNKYAELLPPGKWIFEVTASDDSVFYYLMAYYVSPNDLSELWDVHGLEKKWLFGMLLEAGYEPAPESIHNLTPELREQYEQHLERQKALEDG